MRKLNLLLATLVFFACQKPTENLLGFGGFDIDSNFATNQNSANFKKTMPDEFYCNSIEISNEIGNVSDMNVTTDNGKIIEVKFSSTEKTNIAEIEKQFQSLIKSGKTMKFGTQDTNMKTYSNNNDEIVFIDIEFKNELMKNGQPKHEFIYSNKKAIAENEKLIKSMSSNDR